MRECSDPWSQQPRGAHHVFLRDYPNLDEIKRLKRQGYYDLLSSENLDKLDAMNTGVTPYGPPTILRHNRSKRSRWRDSNTAMARWRNSTSSG